MDVSVAHAVPKCFAAQNGNYTDDDSAAAKEISLVFGLHFEAIGEINASWVVQSLVLLWFRGILSPVCSLSRGIESHEMPRDAMASELDKINGTALPGIKVEEPTVEMSFSVTSSPFVGGEGEHVTSRKLQRTDLSRTFQKFGNERFIISGRGTLRIAILIENMRREGYEFMVGDISRALNEKILS
eukprot:Gb_09143 [translate_table: standard]